MFGRVEHVEGIEMNGSEVRAVATGNPAMFIKKRVLNG